MKDLGEFTKALGIEFSDEKLLKLAFTHRSYVNEHPNDSDGHNERLEFLGDAVLELIVTDFLYKKYPEETEGVLTTYRSALVNTQSLSTVASDTHMNDYLRLSKGESKDTGRARHYILANTFEAVIGAIYLDQGYDAANDFAAEHLLTRTEEMVEKGLWQDAKSRLQEVAQDKISVTPTYKTLKEEGPDHDKQFTIGVFFDAEQIADGSGASKQEAEQNAARAALDARGWS